MTVIPMENNHKLAKYWNQRYNLFSRYDDGIQMDEESWYSVTPEKIAKHIAKRFHKSLGSGHKVIVDGFCGVGGNLIQFALLSPRFRVIGIDISPEKLKMAKNNAQIYGVEHRCDFILGDFMDLVQTLDRIDALFVSPPWGGTEYQALKRYSLSHMTPNGFDIVRKCRKYNVDNIAFLAPRNVDLEEIRHELLVKDHPCFECEQNMVGKKTKTITIYFGDLIGADESE